MIASALLWKSTSNESEALSPRLWRVEKRDVSTGTLPTDLPKHLALFRQITCNETRAKFTITYIFYCYSLAAAGNKRPHGHPSPPPACEGEWKETGRKLVGRDKGSWTEQQTKGTATTTIQKRGITQNRPHDPTEPDLCFHSSFW